MLILFRSSTCLLYVNPRRVTIVESVGLLGLILSFNRFNRVEASTYPPAGIRGTAVGRAADYGQSFEAYLVRADESIARVVQVETEVAVENAAAIAAVDGVNALFVGPADLSTALGVPLEYEDEWFRAAVREVTAAARATDTPASIFVTAPDRIDDWLSLDFTFAIVEFSAKFLIEGNRRLQSAFWVAVNGE